MKEVIELTYLERLAKFANYLGSADHDLEGILKHLSRVVLKRFRVNQTAFLQLVNNEELHLLSTVGMTDVEREVRLTSIPLNVERPVTVSLRENRIIWINSLPDWGDGFPELKKIKANPEDKLYICVPVFQKEIPVAVLTFRCNLSEELTLETEEFLYAVSSIFSLHHFRTTDNALIDQVIQLKVNHPNLGNKEIELTERQRVILRLIAEDRTNKSISNFLGYSESTIRQEIMKIFNKLDCHSRSQAAEIYRVSQWLDK